LAFVSGILLALLATGAFAQSTTLQATEYQITTDPNGHSTPIISSDAIGY